MTLDKQKILSELGSVVNQLQSADCGCMGKLFGNSNQYNNSMASPSVQQGGYRHRCCHSHGYGYNGIPSGEPYAKNTQQSPYLCMGHCNPPKLYADTYNFLNKNLMQPAVQEVYHDLKTISPANTIMNNEMGTKLGLNQPQQALNPPHQALNPYNQIPTMNKNYNNNLNTLNPNQMQNPQMMQNAQMMQNHQVSGMAHRQQSLGGMGPQIMNMINAESIVNSPQPQNGRQLTEPMLIDAPQSPHGQVGVTPLTAPTNINYNNYNSSPSQFYGKNIDSNQQNVYAANVASPFPNMQHNIPQQKPDYVQHNLGIKNFNEIFPGVMQGLGGDLGFDPMAIAIQMNPANQQQAAMNTMQKMMNNNENLGKFMAKSANPAATLPGQDVIMPQSSGANPASQGTPANQLQNNLIMDQTQMNNQQNIPVTNQPINQPIPSYQQQSNAIPAQNRQVYQTSANPQMSQHTLPAQSVHMSPNLATVREDMVMSQPGPQQQTQLPHQQYTSQNVNEPIFPVDTTKQKIYHNLIHRNNNNTEPAYNTLGQPVEKLPANIYHHPIPTLPQTLSPQPMQSNQAKYSNVKSTMSKTSLMGNKPVGQTPSRNQLQQIYNQYKGSQSFTQQNVKVPVEGASRSDRRLNISKETRQQNAIPVEKTGGDSYDNSQLNQKMNLDHVNGQIGDVPIENKPDRAKPVKDLPSINRKYRNGLQDLVYTSYPTSAAWTFHGDGQRSYLTGRPRRFSRHRY